MYALRLQIKAQIASVRLNFAREENLKSCRSRGDDADFKN
jgi:hypothetical protein